MLDDDNFICFKGIGLVEFVAAFTVNTGQLYSSLCTINIRFHQNRLCGLSLCQRVQSCQVQHDESPVGGFWSSSNDGFVLTYWNSPITIFRLEGWKGGIVYVLPLRVEPHIDQTHVWPAAGELVSLYHCANLACRYGFRLG